MFSINRGPNLKINDDDIINRLNCYCHILNNIVAHMCAIDPVKKIIDDTSSLVSYVRNSGLGVKCKPQLKKYVTTRWNTVYDMLSSVSLNFVKLGQILLEKEEADKNANVMSKLSTISRTNLEIIAEFLKKFKDWTKQLEFEKKPTLWMVWPTFVNLKKHLIPLDTDPDIIKNMKAVANEYIEKNTSDFEPQMVHKISTVLNPLLKNIAIVGLDERVRIYDTINDEIQKYEKNVTETEQQEAISQQNVNKNILDDFMGSCSFEELSANVDNNRMEELQRYLNAKIPPRDPYEFDLLGWWFGNRNVYPNLFRYFVSLAGVTASSAPSERSFSETGVIITARRASLLPDTVSDLVLARNMFLEFL